MCTRDECERDKSTKPASFNKQTKFMQDLASRQTNLYRRCYFFLIKDEVKTLDGRTHKDMLRELQENEFTHNFHSKYSQKKYKSGNLLLIFIRHRIRIIFTYRHIVVGLQLSKLVLSVLSYRGFLVLLQNYTRLELKY